MTRPLQLIDEHGEVIRSTCAACNDHIRDKDNLLRDREVLEAENRRLLRNLAALKRDKDRERDTHKQRAMVEEMFELWREKCCKRGSQAKLNNKRFDLAVGRLKEQYTREHFELAIYGAEVDPYVTKTGKVKREWEFIFADGTLLEMFANRGARAVARERQQMEAQA